MSNTQSRDALKELNAKLFAEICELLEARNAEIPELRKKVAESKAEDAKLNHFIEENARRDAENVEHELLK
ncbi:hypothetical protein GLOIN_2v1736632 [Rhizophagus irregularis DAOM 181602=DAOM 197198]|nr:hypothetical protein GLOIN_2v1736632 [Rhizophagus irregularis DAOM 181602=DAOM 197198]